MSRALSWWGLVFWGCGHGATPSVATATTATSIATVTPTASAPAESISVDAGASEPSVDSRKGHSLVVHIIPLGSITDESVEEVARGLRTHAPVTVTVEARHALPSETESVIRGRYRAERILDWMEKLDLGPGKLMGVTEVDIVTKKGTNQNWGVLGLGALDGRCSVLSTFRMKRVWENGGAPEPLVRERLWKTAVHELGHTLGLPHCPNRGCIMEDAHGTVKTSDREIVLCPDCARKFNEAAGAL